MELKGDIVKINEISQSEIEEMYILMTEFYNDVEKDVFLKDLMPRKLKELIPNKLQKQLELILPLFVVTSLTLENLDVVDLAMMSKSS